MAHTMRLFWAVQYPPEQGKKLIAWLKKHTNSCVHPKVSGVRWLDPAFLHCTLHFMGAFPIDAIPAMVEQVNLLILRGEAGMFQAELGPWHLLPRPAKARVLALSLEPKLELRALADLVRKAAIKAQSATVMVRDGEGAQHYTQQAAMHYQRANYKKAFFAHLSVARGKPASLQQLYPELVELPKRLQGFTVEKIVLIASELHSRGAQYDVVATVALERAEDI
ncbi:2'-5' RNA ligase family protein [Zooshikella ganghwensis]|uniref:2'-5' RNA ligase family protein n=1 Tax=Zooshikella ganghwensis TaxID=202772 RepID=UPI0012FA4CCF|nr:hypothetical protein [Zooshikella ganghwensis]